MREVSNHRLSKYCQCICVKSSEEGEPGELHGCRCLPPCVSRQSAYVMMGMQVKLILIIRQVGFYLFVPRSAYISYIIHIQWNNDIFARLERHWLNGHTCFFNDGDMVSNSRLTTFCWECLAASQYLVTRDDYKKSNISDIITARKWMIWKLKWI